VGVACLCSSKAKARDDGALVMCSSQCNLLDHGVMGEWERLVCSAMYVYGVGNGACRKTMR
jgi:hypothetical protein